MFLVFFYFFFTHLLTKSNSSDSNIFIIVHSFIFSNNFILVRVVVDQEFTSGTLGRSNDGMKHEEIQAMAGHHAQ